MIELNQDKILELPLLKSSEFSQEKIKNLTKLSVNSFRGFQTHQDFLFGKRFTFVYGRNGTGKSSFVDAIEYSLMGDIQEAKYKRIDIDDYIKNIYTGNAVVPNLYSMSADGTEVRISPDNEKYKFSVIERSRIDNFSRMSAETSSVQQQRLAALVGLDSWDAFVNAFSKDIGTYLKYENDQQDEIETAEKNLHDLKKSLIDYEHIADVSKRVIEDYLKEFNQETFKMLLKNLTIKKMELSTKLDSIETLSAVSMELLKAVDAKQSEFLDTKKIYHENESKIGQYKNDLSLVELAEAIISQKDNQVTICPACHTIIKNKDGSLNVPVDPFENAEIIKTKFTDAKNLEISNNELRNHLENELRDLYNSIQKLVNQFEAAKLQSTTNLKTLSDAIDDFFDKKETLPNSIWLTNLVINELNDIITKHNFKLNENGPQRIKLQTELDHINKIQGSLETAKKTIDESNLTQQKLRERIITSKKLVDHIKEKAEIAVEKNKPITEFSHAYESLIIKLRDYSESLPNQELTDMNQQTLGICNLINKYDSESEQITELKLPLLSTQVIKVKFNVNDSPLVDALDVLSEGHIRVLGLSILLAKALKQKLPFIVFDDVVNAVDDDHRKAIAEIITDNEGLFSSVQWIVTTHEQEFAKQLINSTSNSMRKNIKEITLKEKTIEADIHYIDKTQNYLILAKEKLEDDDIRGCLADCRREAEVLMIKLWKIYNNRFNGLIGLHVDPSNPVPGTRDVFDTLRSSFKKNLKGNENELAVLANVLLKLEILLDSNGTSWFLLNKGTHEEENSEHHDRNDAEQILNQILVPLDEELTTKIGIKGSVLIRKTL